MKASKATLPRCCKESSDHDLHHGAKAAAGPGSGGPQSKRSLANFHRYGLLIGRHQRRSSAPASLFPVAVRAFLVYLFRNALSLLIYSAHSFTSPFPLPKSLVVPFIGLAMRLAPPLVALSLFGLSVATSDTQK